MKLGRSQTLRKAVFLKPLLRTQRLTWAATLMQAQLAAFLLGDGNASSTAMRSAAQLVQLLESQPAHQAPAQCLPMLPTGLSPGLPYAHASVPLASTQVLLA